LLEVLTASEKVIYQSQKKNAGESDKNYLWLRMGVVHDKTQQSN